MGGLVLTKVSQFIEKREDLWRMRSDDICALLVQCGHWEHRRAEVDYLSSDRDQFIERCGYAIPCIEMVDALRWSGLRILDPMCGSGWMARQLRKAGLRVDASDDGSWCVFQKPNPGSRRTLTWQKPEVMADAAERVRVSGGHAILLSWPWMDDGAARCARAMHQGQLLYYVGELGGGCTADDSFHSMLETDFQEIRCVQIPQFWGLHDQLGVYRKLGRPKVIAKVYESHDWRKV